MGNMCNSVPQIRQVNSMDNRVPNDSRYKRYHAASARFGEPLFTKKRDNVYNFIMTVRSEDELKQVSLDVPILRQLVDCILHPNYDLQIINNKTVIDIFDIEDYTQALVGASHRKTKQLFSLKVYEFRTYSDDIFKKALYQISLHNLIGPGAKSLLNLLDYFIVDRSTTQKAIVFLYEPVETNLLNVIEYRQLANNPWSHDEQASIFKGILTACQNLRRYNIYHRDIRPSRIFYSRIKKQYLLGNLSDALIMEPADAVKDALLTPRGVPLYNSEPLSAIMKRKDLVGHYAALNHDNHNIIRTFLSIINLDHQNTSQQHATPGLREIFNKLNKCMDMSLVMESLKTFETRVDDITQVQAIEYHLGQTNNKINQRIILETLFALHYNEQFSRMAHQQIEYNIESGRPHQNAELFLRLADYFSSSGSNSEDYYINALLLFLKASEKSRHYGYPDRSLQEMKNAKRAEANISDQTYKLMYQRELALVLCELEEQNQAKQTISKTVADAANTPISSDLQLQIILAKANVSLRSMEIEEAQKFFKFGLQISEGRQNFESDAKQLKAKADFLEGLGETYIQQSRPKNNEQAEKESMLNIQFSERKKKLLKKAESNLLAALEIKEHSSGQNVECELSELLQKIGSVYYTRRDFFLAKNSYSRSLEFKKSAKSEMNPVKLAQTYYQLGNCAKHLDDFREAEECYKKALAVFKQNPKDRDLAAVIKGNIALVKIETGRYVEGMREGNAAKEELRQLKGQSSYDFDFLNKQLVKLEAKNKPLSPVKII